MKILAIIMWFSKEATSHPLMFWITLHGEDKTLHAKAQDRSICRKKVFINMPSCGNSKIEIHKVYW